MSRKCEWPLSVQFQPHQLIVFIHTDVRAVSPSLFFSSGTARTKEREGEKRERKDASRDCLAASFLCPQNAREREKERGRKRISFVQLEYELRVKHHVSRRRFLYLFKTFRFFFFSSLFKYVEDQWRLLYISDPIDLVHRAFNRIFQIYSSIQATWQVWRGDS